MGIKYFFGLLVLSGLVSLGCAQGHCRRMSDPPAPAQPLDAEAPTAETPASKASGNERIFVYKYDGSLQCGMGKPVSLESMAKDLAGIQVFSSAKKPDGLMHIQVCGSITGMANVYEIRFADAKKAESKGFKRWSFE